MSKLILVRHGQSVWNAENRFTGWVDVDLSEKGILEAQKSGQLIKNLNINIDVSYTSFLKRAIKTLTAILQENDLELKFNTSWELNERHYGSLTGLNKEETAEKFGKEQVHIWRRSFDVPPPGGESLKNTAERVLPYFKGEIMPKVKEGLNILVAAHGNSLRALVMELEKISSEEIVKLEIATGDPLTYEYSNGEFVRTD